MYDSFSEIRRQIAVEINLLEIAIEAASAQWRDDVSLRVRREMLEPMREVVASYKKALDAAADAVARADRLTRD